MILADLLSSGLTLASSSGASASPGIAAVSDGLEYTISLGNLLTIASFVVFVTVYVVNSRGAAKILAARLETVDANMEDFRREIRKLGDVLIGQAQQDGRISMLDQRLMQQGQRVDELGQNLGEFKNMVLQDTLKRPG